MGVIVLSRINYKLLLVFAFLIFIAFNYISNQQHYNDSIRAILEWGQLGVSLWAAVVICFIMHYFSSKDSGDGYVGLIYKEFGVFADSAFAAVTYGLASTTSASILKGVYIQQFFGDVIYFNYFGAIDIYSMLVVCLFLLGYSIWACCRAVWGAIIMSSSEKAEPVYD
jgi:hypothetical protein